MAEDFLRGMKAEINGRVKGKTWIFFIHSFAHCPNNGMSVFLQFIMALKTQRPLPYSV